MRVWFLKRTNSICTESSVGANTTVWSREGKIYRITPRRNDAVNDTWMTDSGRTLFNATESEDRLIHYTVDGVHRSADETAAAAVNLLKQGSVALLASAQSTVEEQFFYKQIAERTDAVVQLAHQTGSGDGILLSEDRTPEFARRVTDTADSRASIRWARDFKDANRGGFGEDARRCRRGLNCFGASCGITLKSSDYLFGESGQ
jgi:NADH dehydrogenase/NADH:ubiquinone oxidoreductase subunit G